MKYFLSALVILVSLNIYAQTPSNIIIHKKNNYSDIPSFFTIQERIELDNFDEWISENYSFSLNYNVIGTENDKLGMIHYRCQQTIQGVPIHNGIFILHMKDNIIHSVNGNIFSDSDYKISNNQNIDKDTALDFALNYVNADVYKWELEGEEKTLKYILNDDKASFYPEGKLILIPDFTNPSLYYLCWEFNIYAHKPMSRQRIFVDAANGKIRNTINCIHDADVPGTANTGYNGSQSITADSYSGSYRLRESGRGLGVETWDMNEGTDYNNAVDFTDADNNWNNYNAQLDQYATDAHFATESTYDYYYNVHGRNSIDNAGHKLVSYIHFDVQYVNAYWNGVCMTYGDGNSTYSPLTTVDICGHEITHGLTSYTCALDYQNESGAINEGFSDIFGTMVEFYAVPSSANWTIGEDIGTAFRSLADPNAYGLPDTYFGNNWASLSTNPSNTNDYGGVHTNCGVLMYWFYLVSEGGSGTNDNGDSYSITGIGKTKAADIAFRLQTVYLNNSSDYSDARTYAIQSAVDLYGACTTEVGVVTDAMYAVGIGAAYVPTVVSDYTADYTDLCQAPATVNFTNNSFNASSFIWNFGDGTTSTQTSPSHTYNNNGSYTVKLTADGGACGIDSLINTSYITINMPNAPTGTGDQDCGPISLALSASGSGILSWYNQATGGTVLDTGVIYNTPILSNTTIYYVEDQITGTAVYGGATYNASNGDNYNQSTQRWIVFDVNSSIMLKSVEVTASGAGNRIIELQSSTGTILESRTVNIPNGTSRINLDMLINPGTDYRLAGPNDADLFRNDSNCNYPYDIGGLVSLKESNAGSNPTGFYYYFYDWEVTEFCISPRTAVTATIDPSPTALFSTSITNYSVSFTDLSQDAISWDWDFGDANTSTQQNPNHTYATAGTYYVSLTCTNPCGTNQYLDTLNIMNVGIDNNIENIVSIYPNPAKNNITISFDSQSEIQYIISLNNILGQELETGLHTGNGQRIEVQKDIREYAKGIYFIRILSNHININKKVIIK